MNKICISYFFVISFLYGKIKIITYHETSYFTFNFDRKSTLHFTKKNSYSKLMTSSERVTHNRWLFVLNFWNELQSSSTELDFWYKLMQLESQNFTFVAYPTWKYSSSQCNGFKICHPAWHTIFWQVFAHQCFFMHFCIQNVVHRSDCKNKSKWG